MKAILAAVLMLLSTSLFALDACHTGVWYSPERNGEGITVFTLSETDALVYFYTYNPLTAEQEWVMFQGPASNMSAYDTFKESEEPFEVTVHKIGTGSIEAEGDNLIFFYDFLLDIDNYAGIEEGTPWCLADYCSGLYEYKRLVGSCD